MSEPRRLAGFTPVHLLVLVAVAELSITRLAVPTLAPKAKDAIPTWYVGLDNVGLFLLYFGTTLALSILVVRAWQMLRDRSIAGAVFGAALALCSVFAVVDVVITPSEELSFLFHTAWAGAIGAVVVAALVRRRDLAVAIGISAFALPLLFHYGAVLIGHFTSDDEAVETMKEHAHDWGLFALVLAALASPYCLSPRPAMRSIGKIGPIVVALLIGVLGAVLVRREYKAAMDLASLGVGVDLMPGVSNNDMALYLLALSTLAWTFTACAIAESEARREVGMGLGLVVLGGYGFAWPMHFLLGVVGLLVMYDASARVKEEETPRAGRPRTPPIPDETWQTWITALGDALRADDPEVKIVTVRSEDETTQTVLVGERHGVPFKARFGRMMGALVAIDVIAGREVPETQRATFTLYARPDDGAEAHPQPPPAAPSVQLEDAAFAQRFRVRGEASAVTAVLDDALRARATAMLDGWVAWWAGAGMRFRVYPAVGAPIDHPVPIADLAMKGVGQVERMAGVIDVITSAAARGLEGVKDEPAVLE